MSHTLIGLALCGALLIYPGGMAMLVAAMALGSGPRWRWPIRTGAGLGWTWHSNSVPMAAGALALAGLAVMPLPWPGNPVEEIDFAGITVAGVGGLALTLLGLLCLEAWVAQPNHRGGAGPAVSGLWSLSAIVLAELLAAPGWSTLLTTSGPGAEAARIGVGVLCVLAGPWASGVIPYADCRQAAAWAVRLTIALFLCFPELRQAPFAVCLAAVWAACLIVGWLLGGGGRGAVASLPFLTDDPSAARL